MIWHVQLCSREVYWHRCTQCIHTYSHTRYISLLWLYQSGLLHSYFIGQWPCYVEQVHELSQPIDLNDPSPPPSWSCPSIGLNDPILESSQPRSEGHPYRVALTQIWLTPPWWSWPSLVRSRFWQLTLEPHADLAIQVYKMHNPTKLPHTILQST